MMKENSSSLQLLLFEATVNKDPWSGSVVYTSLYYSIYHCCKMEQKHIIHKDRTEPGEAHFSQLPVRHAHISTDHRLPENRKWWMFSSTPSARPHVSWPTSLLWLVVHQQSLLHINMLNQLRGHWWGPTVWDSMQTQRLQMLGDNPTCDPLRHLSDNK